MGMNIFTLNLFISFVSIIPILLNRSVYRSNWRMVKPILVDCNFQAGTLLFPGFVGSRVKDTFIKETLRGEVSDGGNK